MDFDLSGALRRFRHHIDRLSAARDLRFATLHGAWSLFVCFLMIAAAPGVVGLGMAAFGLFGVVAAWNMAAQPMRSRDFAVLQMHGAVFVWACASLTGGGASPMLGWSAVYIVAALFAGTPRYVAFATIGHGAAVAFCISGIGAPAGIVELTPGLAVAAHGLTFAYLAAYGAMSLIAARNAASDARRDKAVAVAVETNAADFTARLFSDGRIRKVSRKTRALTDIGPSQLRGKSLLAFAHPDDRAALREALAETAMRRLPSTADVRLPANGGGWIWFEFRCRPMSLHSAGPIQFGVADGIVSACRDITARKQREEALAAERDMAVETSRAKSEFLANMSHELRTPLNAIIGFADMMAEQTYGPLGHDKYSEYAHLVSDSGRHLLDLIGDVLDLSKIEARKQTLTLEAVDVVKCARQCVRMLNAMAQKNGVQLELRAHPDLKTVTADARALAQMLLNLLSNAVKFTPEGGKAALSIYPENGCAVFAVTDTGVGIPVADLERLGAPFEQAASSPHGAAGAGLGLALVRKFAELHGGDMKIESREGQGARISIILPITHVDAPVQEAAPAPRKVVRARRAEPAAPASTRLSVHAQFERLRALRAELDDAEPADARQSANAA